MANLAEILQNTLHTSSGIRQEAEDFVRESLASNEFVFSLLDFSCHQENALHLRQARKRLSSFGSDERSELCRVSLLILCSPERLLKNCGISLLASLFNHGIQSEKEYIITTLFSALSSDDLESLQLACSCICEIVADADLNSQLTILKNCHSRLVEIIVTIDREEIDFLRNASKIYRVIACRISDCKVAEESTPDLDNDLRPMFEGYIEVVCRWLKQCTDTEDIIASTRVLVEMVRFLGMIVDMYPDLCMTSCSFASEEATAEGVPYIAIFTNLAWMFLYALVHVHSEYNCSGGSLSRNSFDEHMHLSSGDGDRVGIEMLIIYLFELLQECLHTHRQTFLSHIGIESMSELILIITRYMQLSSHRVNQYFHHGNEFISAEEDESYELSVRHGGKNFIMGIYGSAPRLVFEAVMVNTETQLTQLPADANMSESDVLWLEAVLFTFTAVGKKFVRKCLKEIKKDSAEGNESVPSADRNAESEEDCKRVVAIIRQVVRGFYINFSKTWKDSTDMTSTRQLAQCVARGSVSKVLRCYAPLLPERLTIRPILNTAIQLLAGVTKTGLHFEEAVAARLLHCQASCSLLQVVARRYGAESVLDEDHLVDDVVNYCLQLCVECSDYTIHIPLETITMYITTAVHALGNILSQEDSTNQTLPAYISAETISKIVVAVLTIWSNYCYDPFVLEVSKEVMLSLVRFCSFSDTLVEILSAEFIPPIEGTMASGSMSADAAAKSLCENAVKLLVDASSPSINKFTTCAGSFALPALAATNTMLELALVACKENECSIDVGDTLYTFCSLMSTGNIAVIRRNIPEELSNCISNSILHCVGIIFDTGVDYSYAAALGSLCHLVTTFSDCFDFAVLKDTIHCIVGVARHTVKSNNRRNIIIMGLVHLFCRNPEMIAAALNSMTISDDETALHFVLDDWFVLHPLLESYYSLRVSSHGIIHVIRLYAVQGVSEGFLMRTLRVLLGKLPQLISMEERESHERKCKEMDEDNCSSRDLSDSEDELAYDYSEDEDVGEDGGDDDDQFDPDLESTEGAVGDSPFAPAEMYLSDIIDIAGYHCSPTTSERMHVYVPDDMVYSPHKADPLCKISVQHRLGDLFKEAMSDTEGLLLHCLNSLRPQEQQLVHMLLQDLEE